MVSGIVLPSLQTQTYFWSSLFCVRRLSFKVDFYRVPTGGVRCDQPHAPYSIKVRLLQYQ